MFVVCLCLCLLCTCIVNHSPWKGAFKTWTWTWFVLISLEIADICSFFTDTWKSGYECVLIYWGGASAFFCLFCVLFRLFPNSCGDFSQMESNPNSLVGLYLDFFSPLFLLQYIGVITYCLRYCYGYTVREEAGQLMGGSPSKGTNVVNGNKKKRRLPQRIAVHSCLEFWPALKPWFWRHSR